MARLELGADGMVRLDGRIIAEIAYFDQEFADIIEAAEQAFSDIQFLLTTEEVGGKVNSYIHFRKLLEKAGWWKS